MHRRRPPHCGSGRLSLSDQKMGPRPDGARPRSPSNELVLLLHNARASIRAGGSGDVDLGMTIVRIAPPSSFEQAVRSGNLAHSHPARQITARINHAAPELANV